jgi:hypothetical protein
MHRLLVRLVASGGGTGGGFSILFMFTDQNPDLDLRGPWCVCMGHVQAGSRD